MQFKDGTSVYTLDDQNVGHIDRVVLNANTKEVTHIVVRKGFLFTEDKIVPLNLIISATEEHVVLQVNDADDLHALPLFEETHYLPLDETEYDEVAYESEQSTPVYWYPPPMSWKGYGYQAGYADPPPYTIETEQNIPQGTVALKEDARVMSVENHHVGNVVRIFTESEHNQATHFLISDGIIFKNKKLVPVSWIREIKEDEIHLGVGAAMLDKLPEYQDVS